LSLGETIPVTEDSNLGLGSEAGDLGGGPLVSPSLEIRKWGFSLGRDLPRCLVVGKCLYGQGPTVSNPLGFLSSIAMGELFSFPKSVWCRRAVFVWVPDGRARGTNIGISRSHSIPLVRRHPNMTGYLRDPIGVLPKCFSQKVLSGELNPYGRGNGQGFFEFL